VPAQAQTSVTTWQYDTLRTGQNVNETVLTPTNVSSSTFGQLCSANLNGQVYAQPLVLSNVTFSGTQYASLVYVVTEMNTLYVINGTPPAQGTPCSVVATLSLNPPGQYPVDCNYLGAQNCGTVNPVVGALGTPVIQSVPNSNGVLYVVTETQDVASGMPANWYHYLHAVNLDQLAELTPPVHIYPPGPVWYATQISYWSRHHIQRPGLLLVNNNELYIGFSMMDGTQPLVNGSIFGFNTANLSLTPNYFATSPDTKRDGGGIWQGGAGLAYGPDKAGNNYIYFNTANGSWDGTAFFGDSFLKVNPNLGSSAVAGSFTPADQTYRACLDPYTDIDFGSGGVMLTPASANWPYLAVSGDKEGGIWLMDRTSPGGYHPGTCQACQFCDTTTQDAADENLQTVWLGTGKGPAMHNNPAYWNNFVYIAPVAAANSSATISQYQLCNNSGSGKPFCNAPVIATAAGGHPIKATYGATPTISANGSTNGILWAISGVGSALSTTPSQLFAIDATTMQGLYASSGFGSTCQQVDQLFASTKFSVPTVANGFVYIGGQSANTTPQNTGQGTFYIFGLGRTCGQSRKIPVSIGSSVK
jgi:hypothetical protein